MTGLVRAAISAIGGRVVIAYFDLVYRLLLGSAEGRLFIARAAPPGAPQAHSYVTASDIDRLVSFLDLLPGEVVLDLGCGFGEVALVVHARSGADVIGIETSPVALAEAQRRFVAAQVEQHVRGVNVNIARVSSLAHEAQAAYEIDALMFVPSHWSIYASLLRRMGAGSRLFATTLEFGPGDARQTRQRLLDSGLVVERLEDVTDAMLMVSERRRRTALRILRSRGARLPGGLAMLAVIVEETVMGRLVRRGLVRRWRISAR